MKIIWNSELYHYGQPRRSGRYKWGSGKDPYHHGASVPRRLIRKYDRLQEKLDKNHAERKLEKGKDISRRQQKAIDKYNDFSSKADMAGSRTAKKRSKLGSLESEEQRIIAKMNKLDKKLEKKYIKDVDPDDLKRGKEYLDSLDIMTKKIMDDYKGYDRFPYSGEASPNTYKGAREKAKALMDSRSKETINAIEKLGYKYNDSDVERYGNYNFEKTVKVKDGTLVDINAQTKRAPDKKYIQEVDTVVASKASKWVADGKQKAVELNSMTIRDPKNVTSPYIVCRADDSGRKLKTVDVSFVNEEDNHYPSASYDMKKKRWTGSYDG